MASTIAPVQLTCEYRTNPVGIGAQPPRLSWKLQAPATERGAKQTGYQISVVENFDATHSPQPIWDTGKVDSDQSVLLTYNGPAVRSGQRYYWRVRVWDSHGDVSDWSEVAFWEMGLLSSSDWQAGFISPDWEEDINQPQPAPILRRAFQLDSEVKSARLYATALGLYEVHLNGQRVGEDLLAPGWTSYDHHLQHQTYDVTHLLNPGENVLGALLGDGWYRGNLGFERRRNSYGDHLALLCQLHVTYANGRNTIIKSDTDWRATTGPIRSNDLYNGETYDARQELPGWNAPGYDDSGWKSVRILDRRLNIVSPQLSTPVRKQGEIKPTRVFKTPKGETVFDFAQNMVGWVRLRVHGPAGTTVTIKHAEVLDQDGNFYTENLRYAQQTLRYTLKGEGVEIYEPYFTFMGFQFIQIEGFPGEPTLDNVTGIVVHSDMPTIGSFECNNPLINQLQKNIVWGQKGNFVDVPTDCPQRDERLGWTGDAQAFVRTACFNRDVGAFFTKWLRDLSADQRPSGSVPFVIPDVMARQSGGINLMSGGAGSAAWSDAAVICPWTLYLSYGDKGILEQQYNSMVAWVNYMREQAGERYLITTGFHFGDWLDFRGNALMPSPTTNKELVATAFFAYCANLMTQIAGILGNDEDAAMYASLSSKIKRAFNAEFVTPNGSIGSGSQTCYVLALHFDLLPEKLRAAAAERLAQAVRTTGNHLTTGFVGTPYLCHVLSRFGYNDLAYELLNREGFPSWLYPVKKGATTIWERWDGIKPDGSFQDVGMNSFNHYAYGAIGEWMYRVVAGIETDVLAAGYKHSLIQPQPGGGLTQVRASLQTPFGELVSAWQLSETDFKLQVTVPPNTTATVRIPASKLTQVTESGKSLKSVRGITSTKLKGKGVIIEVGSGTYAFVSTGYTLVEAMANVMHVAGRVDLGSVFSDVLANPQGKAMLEKHLGAGLLSSPLAGIMANAPLQQVINMLPQFKDPANLQNFTQDLLAMN